ncbi:MAG: serine hydrolase domain-containing protein [Gemmatimonadales bacterium]
MLLVASLALMIPTLQAQSVDTAVAWGIKEGSFPGAVVVLGTSDRILLAKGYGHFTWSAESKTPTWDGTLYDLASLTKVVATTPSVMRLVESGKLALDARVQEYLPDFVGKSKELVTVRHLLQHRSGLRPFLPLNKLANSGTEARSLVMVEPLRWKPGSHVAYSDLNAMLLGWVVERVAGMPLNEFAKSEVFRPLRMSQTVFNPARSLRGRIAPVGLWHGHVIAGALHDQNAVRLGGVSGHAGLYSTGKDLARYAQMYLRRGRDERQNVFLRNETITQFTARGLRNRGLGWELRDTTSRANTGDLLSSSAFGHTGYTGTSIWIDPVRDLFVILLTNRVFAPRSRRSITVLKETRARVADAAVRLKSKVCGRKCTR